MGRNGKRMHRNKHFRPPVVKGVEKTYENYGIITKYHGGASRHCDILAYDNGALVELKQVRMKGAITSSKCKQRVVIGNYVLLEYGEIAQIYAGSDIVPQNVRAILGNCLESTEEVEFYDYDLPVVVSDSEDEEETVVRIELDTI